MYQNENGIWLPDNFTVFVKPSERVITQRKMEGLQKLAELKAWGLRNPTKWMSTMFGIDLLDSQAYAVAGSWDKMYALWLCSRNFGKSTLLGAYAMTRGMLMNNWRGYICAGTSDQSIETFVKIESIAKRQIESMTGLTDVFINEVVVNQGAGDGFIHNPAGFTYSLYNGSFVKTLNSNVNAKRGKRAEWVCFDESGWLSEEVFSVIEPYTAQNKDFKLGGGIDTSTLPRELPNQLMYTSSASAVDSAFYNKFKQYSKAMIYGSKDHFVADLNCDVVINATFQGKIYPASLLTQEKVDTALKENKEKALREYYNKFTRDGGVNAVVKRSQIIKNSVVMPPVLFNDTGDRLFGLMYDPARNYDNSVILIVEYYQDKNKGWKMRICNCVSLADLGKRNKTPMRTPEQVEALKQLILDYNNGGDEFYSNIHVIGVDAGTGGAGINIMDYLVEDWTDKQGHTYHGLIDKEFDPEISRRFPQAINKVRLLQPTAYKSIMYEALIEMASQDLIEFTSEYDHKGYLSLIDVDEKKMNAAKEKIELELKDQGLSPEEYQERLDEAISKIDGAKTRMYKLSPDEEIALVQIDLMKEEVVNMVRKKRESGKDSFELVEDKKNKMHDDKAYTLAMAAYFLSELRRQNIVKRTRPSAGNIASILPIRQAKRNKLF